MPHRPVRDVMQREVVTLAPENDAREAERVLARCGVGGAPVVDERGHVVGVVSQTDLVRLEIDPPSTAEIGAFFSNVEEYRDLGRVPVSESLVRIAEIMQREVLSIAPDAPLWEAAATMRRHRVHRLLVLENGRLCGVVSALDLLIAVEEAGAARA